MLVENLVARRTRTMFRAFGAKDVDGVLGVMGPDIEMEFPAGLPIAGRWRGEQLRAVLSTIMQANERIEPTLREIVVDRPWSPLGRMRIYTLWSVKQVAPDGRSVTSEVATVTEVERWRPVRSRELYSDVPALAHHLERSVLPARPEHLNS